VFNSSAFNPRYVKLTIAKSLSTHSTTGSIKIDSLVLVHPVRRKNDIQCQAYKVRFPLLCCAMLCNGGIWRWFKKEEGGRGREGERGLKK
jgi:hypothetical protein